MCAKGVAAYDDNDAGVRAPGLRFLVVFDGSDTSPAKPGKGIVGRRDPP